MTNTPKIVLAILVADDNEADGILLSQAITEVYREAQLRLTNTQQKTLLAIAEFNPDIVFLDLRFHDSNGISIVVEVRKLTRDAVIIVTTGDSDLRKIPACIDAGADDYLLKGTASINAVNIERTVKVAQQCREKYVLQPLRKQLAVMEASHVASDDALKNMKLEVRRLEDYHQRLKQGVGSGGR